LVLKNDMRYQRTWNPGHDYAGGLEIEGEDTKGGEGQDVSECYENVRGGSASASGWEKKRLGKMPTLFVKEWGYLLRKITVYSGEKKAMASHRGLGTLPQLLGENDKETP